MEVLAKEVQNLVKDAKVLFVEDDESLVETTFPILSELFLEVTVAKDGLEGFKQYKNQKYDLVITDIRMPYMNGIELVKEIRKISETQKICVMSAHKETDYFIELINLHVRGFISKPFELRQFLMTIKKCFEESLEIEPLPKIHLAKQKSQKNESQKKETILVIDDTVDNLTLITDLLKDIYKIQAAKSGQIALDFLRENENPNLILLDVMMPDMDGYDVIKELKNNIKTKDIPVVFLTAKSSIEDEKKGFDLGAEDYITKPISPVILRARVKTQLQNAHAKKFLQNKNNYLEAEIEKRIQEIYAIQNVSIQVLSSLAETRDQETGNHIKRTQLYVKLLAQYLSSNPKFSADLTPEKIKTIYISAPLHDIGKVGIPDYILLKPGKLTPEEFEIMKKHTTLGREAIKKAEMELGYRVNFLKVAKDIAYYHHEKFDGTGYPTGLKGEEIPISARLMAIADVYDALISERVYKKGMSHEEAVKIITNNKGTHFDPDIVDAFIELNQEFKLIADRFKESKEDLEIKSNMMSILQEVNDGR